MRQICERSSLSGVSSGTASSLLAEMREAIDARIFSDAIDDLCETAAEGRADLAVTLPGILSEVYRQILSGIYVDHSLIQVSRGTFYDYECIRLGRCLVGCPVATRLRGGRLYVNKLPKKE